MHLKLTEYWKDKVFFTADTHFGHKNIINYCSRPFTTVESMNETLVAAWNQKIPEDGLVFHLGDFAMKITLAEEFWEQLNGTIIMLKGNHDKTKLVRKVNSLVEKDTDIKLENLVPEIVDLYIEDSDIGDVGMRMALCHYPMGAWNYKFHGSVQLFGHVHTTPRQTSYYVSSSKQLDVGVDNNDFVPVSYAEVLAYFTKMELKGDK